MPDELKALLEKTSRAFISHLKEDFVAINHFAQEDANKCVIELEEEKSLLVKQLQDENDDLRKVIKSSDITIEELEESLTKTNEAFTLLQSRMDNRNKEFQNLFERSMKHFADSELTTTVKEIKQHLFGDDFEMPEML